MYETYIKVIKIEANTMIHMAAKHYIPAVIHYTTRLAQSINAVASACPQAELSVQRKLLQEVSRYLADASTALEQLKPLMGRVDSIDGVKEMALAYHDAVVPAMDALRYPIDLSLIHIFGKAHLLGPLQGVGRGHALAALQLILHVDDALEAVQEPQVHLGDVVDLLGGETAAQSLSHHEQTLVGDLDQQVLDLVGVQALQLVQLQGADVQLQRADGLHQGTLKGVGNGHNLAGGLHLGAQSTAGGGELIKGQAGDVYKRQS